MRDTEKKSEQAKQPVTQKLYPKDAQKSTPSLAKQASRKGVQARQKRIAHACSCIGIAQLAKHLQLQTKQGHNCPSCQHEEALQLDEVNNSFHCKACKSKGNNINLVSRAKKLQYWKAIAFIEELSKQAASTKNSNAEPKPKPKQVPPTKPSHDCKEKSRQRIARIKQQHRIEDVIADMANVSLHKVGKDLRCQCPFPDHEDKTPSFNITPEKQLFHCFGCGKTGDVIRFVEQYKNCKFREALDLLDPQSSSTTTNIKATETTPIACPTEKNQLKKEKKGMAPMKELTPTQTAELATRLTKYFHQRISESSTAKDFLRQRGLFDPKLVEYFQLGFDDGRVNQTITDDIAEPLEQMGIINDKRNSRFYQCLTVGLEDRNGNTISIYGRRVNEEKGAKHQFPHGPIKGILNNRAFKCSKAIILTEGVIDALSVWRIGYPNVSCVFSASSIPTLLIDQLTSFSIEKVYLAFDNDKQGEAISQKLVEKLKNMPLEILRIEFPDGIKDANELLVKQGKNDANFTFSQLIKNAVVLKNSADSSISGNSKTAKNELQMQWVDGKGIFYSKKLNYEVEMVGRERGALRVVLTASRQDRFHTDKLDLFRSQARTSFSYTASKRFSISAGSIEEDLESILVIMRKLPKDNGKSKEGEQTPTEVYSEAEKLEALAWLKQSNLLDVIIHDYELLGYVGEDKAKQVVYLSASSRKLEKPLPCIIYGSSAGGKSLLMEMTAKLMPKEDVLYLSELSKQALYYMTTERIRHKLVIVDERKGSEEADYALRTLLSRGELRKAVPVKDSNGQMQTIIRELKGPISHPREHNRFGNPSRK